MLKRSLEKLHWKIPFLLVVGFQIAFVRGDEDFSHTWPERFYVGFQANSTHQTLETKPSKRLEEFIVKHGEASERTSLTTDEVTFPFLTMYVCNEELVLDSLYSIRGIRSGGIGIMRVADENITRPAEGGWKVKSLKPDRLTFIPKQHVKEFIKILRESSTAVDAELAADLLEREQAKSSE